VIWLRRGNQPTTAIEETLRRNFAVIHDFVRQDDGRLLELY
jgi:predicted nuclease of predicted toxin-antitoxin system